MSIAIHTHREHNDHECFAALGNMSLEIIAIFKNQLNL